MNPGDFHSLDAITLTFHLSDTQKKIKIILSFIKLQYMETCYKIIASKIA